MFISEIEAINKSCPFDPDRLSCGGSRCMAWIAHGRDHGRCAMIPSATVPVSPTIPAVDTDELAKVTAERDHLENVIADFVMKAEKHFRETD